MPKKSSLIAKAIDLSKSVTAELEKVQDQYSQLEADSQALKELKPLIKKVNQLYPTETTTEEKPPKEYPESAIHFLDQDKDKPKRERKKKDVEIPPIADQQPDNPPVPEIDS